MKKKNNHINQIICGNSLEVLPTLDNNFVDIVLTDPPYFLDKMDDKWKYEKVTNKNSTFGFPKDWRKTIQLL